MGNIKTLAEKVTEGFSLVEGPKMLELGEKDKIFELNGKYHLSIFPSIARAFPTMFLSSAKMDNLAHMENYFQFKSGLGCVNKFQFPMNAQQYTAISTMFKIETAGVLVDLFGKYARGEDSVIWNYKISGMPTDTSDNGFITKMMNWLGDFEMVDRIKDGGFTVEQLKNMSSERVGGAFYQKFGNKMKKCVLDYHDALGDLRKMSRGVEDEFVIGKYFQSCRNLYEEGMSAVRQLESSSLNQYPTWVASEGYDVKKGDYVQGIFMDGEQCICAEGNVENKRDDVKGIYFGLKNASEFCNGKGKEKLENLLLEKDFWYSRIWKFEGGEK